MISDERLAILERYSDSDHQDMAREIRVLRNERDQRIRMLEAIQRDAGTALEQRRAAVRERDNARCNARILAHAYTTDNRPPSRVVAESLAYPVRP